MPMDETEPNTALRELFYSIHPEGSTGVAAALGAGDAISMPNCAGLLLDEEGKFKLTPVISEARSHSFISVARIAEQFEAAFGEAATAAELWVLMSLLSGTTLKEMSARDNVSYETRRFQLKCLQAKSGLGKQADLLVRMASLLASQTRVARTQDNVSADSLRRMLTKNWDVSFRSYPFTSDSGEEILVGELGPVDGTPILVLHSGFFSIFPLPDDAQILEDRGIRVITPFRPGYYGDLSETQSTKASLDNYLKCLAEFVSVYRLRDVPTVAFMQGVEVALHLLAKGHIAAENILLVNANYTVGGASKNGSFHMRAAVKLAQSSPAAARIFYRAAVKSLTSVPSTVFALKQYFGSSSEDVNQIEKSLSQSDLLNILKEAFLENLPGFVNDLPSVARKWPRISVDDARKLRFIFSGDEAFSDLEAFRDDLVYGNAITEIVADSGRIGLMRNSTFIFDRVFNPRV